MGRGAEILAAANALVLKSGNTSANQRELAKIKEGAHAVEAAEAAPVEPPAPTPEPVPPPKPDIFAGDTLAKFSLIQAQPATDVSEVTDPLGSSRKVFRVAVGDEDDLGISGNPRAEIITPENLFEDGSDFWMLIEVLFPSSFVAPPDGEDFMICAEGPYGAPYGGSPPWSLGIFTDDKIGWQRNESHDWDIPWQAPLLRGAWQRLLVHQKFATSGGFVECWLNGGQITFFGDPTLDNPAKIAPTTKLPTKTIDKTISKGPWAVHLDLYRKLHSVRQVDELFFGPLLIGTTRASVGG